MTTKVVHLVGDSFYRKSAEELCPKELPSDILNRDGWAQGAWGAPGENHCLVGAFQAALSLGEGTLLPNVVDMAITAVIGTKFNSQEEWNDHPLRTERGVIKAARRIEVRLGWRTRNGKKRPRPTEVSS